MCVRLLVLVPVHIQPGLILNKSKVRVLLMFSEGWMKLKIASPALAWGGAIILFVPLH